jgi:hypothetical protein
MNPILSDLHIRNAVVENETRMRDWNRIHQAKGFAANVGLGTALMNAVRQFVNPRRYAMSAVEVREHGQPATSPAPDITPALGVSVTASPTVDMDFPKAA